MIEKLKSIANLIGNSPIVKLNQSDIDLYLKLEYNNLSGSIKDRAAYNILMQGIIEGHIKKGTKIVESSSGNFAIALAHLCKHLGLEFIPVIDPNILPGYEYLLGLLVSNVVKVSTRDHTGGYLLTRIALVKQLCAMHENIFWTNQYENQENYRAYYSLGDELKNQLHEIDYVFVGVSSGGTITGLSIKLKQHFPNIKIVAVDVEGSVIFNRKPCVRHVSGIGSSKRPAILENALIDDVVIVTEAEIVTGCNNLLNEHAIFGGGSTGASYSAIRKYFETVKLRSRPTVLFLCPDKGSSYIQTIYSPEWCKRIN